MDQTGRRFSLQKLRACLEQDRYRLHPHVWTQLRELNIDLHDALHVLRQGTIEAEPEFDFAIQQWRFTVRGLTVDGKHLSIVLTFVEIDDVVVLTVGNGEHLNS